ncbi:hypothetical protein [Actinospica robiniae]|uniref:hypothetical protein n=1 Tax=Actinospica robiniae TaxID=304901 RepID=UPI0004035419|nr:hypothetical protein [Actinospica robiniae]
MPKGRRRGRGRVVALTCIGCGCYADVVGEYRPDGTAAWSPHNAEPSHLPEAEEGYEIDPPSGRLGLGPRRTSPVAGTAWPTAGSALGGLPDWWARSRGLPAELMSTDPC